MPKATIIRLHVHRGRTRTLHVGFVVTVCERVPVDVVKLVVQDLLLDAGASTRAVKSVTVAAVPAPPTRSA